MKQYAPSDWKKLLDHVTVTEWVRPQHMDAFLKQMLLGFYPVIKGKSQAKYEQAAATMAVTGHEVYLRNLKAPSQQMEEEKREQAKLSMEDFLGQQLGLESGLIRKAKARAYRDSFKWPYQISDFGDAPTCVNCHAAAEFTWKAYRGDWIVRCVNCGWKKTFHKAWIDRQYLKAQRDITRCNSETRRFSSSEDSFNFYFSVVNLLVPEESDGYRAIVSIN